MFGFLTSLQCARCKMPISGRYLKLGKTALHPECFICHDCHQPIEGAYQQSRSKPYHPECYQKRFGFQCDQCGDLLGDAWVTYQNNRYHQHCYEAHIQPHCAQCDKAIIGKYIAKDGQLYHQTCYAKYFLPKCCVCHRALTDSYITDSWGNSAHKSHSHSPTPICHSCGRIIGIESSQKGVQLADGRYSCGICQTTAVVRSNDALTANRFVRDVLAEKGLGNIPLQIPVTLVNRERLKVESAKTKGDTQGLAKSYRQVLGDKIVSETHEIFILSHLPKLEFMAVLAHELLHIWCTIHNVTLTKAKLEGFCNLGSMLIYQLDNSPLAHKQLDKMEQSPDRIYGDGYRKMKKELEQSGWQKLIIKLSR